MIHILRLLPKIQGLSLKWLWNFRIYNPVGIQRGFQPYSRAEVKSGLSCLIRLDPGCINPGVKLQSRFNLGLAGWSKLTFHASWQLTFCWIEYLPSLWSLSNPKIKEALIMSLQTTSDIGIARKYLNSISTTVACSPSNSSCLIKYRCKILFYTKNMQLMINSNLVNY